MTPVTSSAKAHVPLSVLRPGQQAMLRELGSQIEAIQRDQLLAYGLSPGQLLTVQQVHPMSVVQIDEVELAIEKAVAHDIWVEIV
jgi:Fe2+ transport system protein FeoA